MSKDGSAGGGTNINIDDLLAMNPELIEQLATEPAAQSAAPVEASIPAEAPPTRFYGTNTSNQINQPDAKYYQSFAMPGTNDFYGSGTEITQPGTDYYHSFPMPGEDAAKAPRPTSTPIPIFDINEYDDSEIFDGSIVGGEGNAGGMTYAPVYGRAGLAAEPEQSAAPVYGRRGINPSMPILDAAEEDEEIAYYDPRFNNFNIGTM